MSGEGDERVVSFDVTDKLAAAGIAFRVPSTSRRYYDGRRGGRGARTVRPTAPSPKHYEIKGFDHDRATLDPATAYSFAGLGQELRLTRWIRFQTIPDDIPVAHPADPPRPPRGETVG